MTRKPVHQSCWNQMARGLAILAATSFAGAPARAQGGDAAAIEACIQSKITAEQEPNSCIGVLAQPCLDSPKGQTTAGMIACLDREAKAWAVLLDDYDARLSGQLDSAGQEALRDVQRAWTDYRDKACGFYRIYRQGTIAGPAAATCVNDETARRALALREMLNDVEGR